MMMMMMMMMSRRVSFVVQNWTAVTNTKCVQDF